MNTRTPGRGMVAHPVFRAVNTPKNNVPELIEPVHGH
jgi:hypothetical protein